MTTHHKLMLQRPETGPGWLPACSCGWIGIPRRRKAAEGEYRRHVASVERRRATELHDKGPAPCELTPPDQLPAELQTPRQLLETAVTEAVTLILSKT